MSTSAGTGEPVLLDVLAALVEADSMTGVAATASPDERRLADALRGQPEGAAPGPDAPALAELLRLASGARAADDFVVGLRQVFLIPDDSRPPPGREARADAFAELYRRLALPRLPGDSASRAQGILQQLTRA